MFDCCFFYYSFYSVDLATLPQREVVGEILSERRPLAAVFHVHFLNFSAILGRSDLDLGDDFVTYINFIRDPVGE